MIETITPAGCGSRRRQLVALALFTVGATLAAAALGALLGALGALLGAAVAVPAAAVLALLGVLREAGVRRVPLPQLRRQVPERWRRELPLPLWSAGYGAGLGVGILTHQTVATFWVACAAAVAVADPLVAALLLSLHGVGRAAGPLWSARRRGGDPAEAVDVVLAARPRMLRANVAALAACAVLLAAAPVADAAPLPLGAGSQFDPAVAGGVLAHAERVDGVASVVVRAPGSAPVRFTGGRAPALHGDLLAYVMPDGVWVVRRSTGQLVVVVPGDVGGVALHGTRLVHTTREGPLRRLWLVDLATGYQRALAQVPARVELSRPAFDGARVAWGVVGPRSSTVVLLDLASDRRRTVAHSAIALHTAPALAAGRLAWVERRSGTSSLRLQAVAGGPVRTVARLVGHGVAWTGAALGPRAAFVTREVEGRRARLERLALPASPGAPRQAR